MNRRTFLMTSAGGVAGVAAGKLYGVGPERVESKRYSKFDYIDIHTHLGTFLYGKPLLGRSLVRMMDRHHVERAVVLPLVSPEAAPYPQTTEAALAFCKKFPGRLIPFCCVDPRASSYPPQRPGHVKGVKGLVQILKRYQDAGCRGFGEHKVGLPFDEPRMMQLYEACAEVEFPILFHLDDIRSWDGPGLPRLENALKSFPDLPFIGHAAGFWASISGDVTGADFGRYPEIPKPVAPGGALDRLMKKYPNLYGDLSEPGGERALRRDPKFAREFIIRNAGQLLFGTDFLKPNQEVPHFELLASLNLPEVVQYKVYRGNAMALLNLNLEK